MEIESIKPIINEITQIIRKYLAKNDYKIYLFGSWARKDAGLTFDIDIGILGKEKVNFDIMSKILREKEAILPVQKQTGSTLRSIDIPACADADRLDLNTKSEDFKNKASKEGKLLD